MLQVNLSEMVKRIHKYACVEDDPQLCLCGIDDLCDKTVTI